MEMGIPLTPRSPRPKILEPERFNPWVRNLSRSDEALGVSFTIGYDSDPGLLDVWPVLEDLSDTALVLNTDILSNKISVMSHDLNSCVTHQTLGTPVDVGIAETRITHSWGVYQGRNLGEVLSAEFVENVDVGILELRQVLDGAT